MKKEEFIRKFIDNELSVSQKDKFLTIVEKDKEMNEELTTLSTLENSLIESKTTLRDSDLAFLTAFKSELVNDLKNQPASKFSPVYWKEFLHNYSLITIFSLLFIVGSIVSYFHTTEIKNKYQISFKPFKTNHQPELKKFDNETLFIENKIAEKTPEANREADKNVRNKEIQLASTEEKNELTLSINEKNILTNQELVVKLKSDLENYERNADLLNIAITKKRIGQLFGKMNGKSDEAKTYLIQSAAIFEQLKYREMQAECLGELALIEFSTGNNVNAEEYFNKCIQLLQSNNSKKLKYWQDKYYKNFRE